MWRGKEAQVINFVVRWQEVAMETHIALIAIPEIVIVLIVLGCIAWVVWAVRQHKQASEIAALGQAGVMYSMIHII
jgi:hypothetical protein